VSRSVRRPEKIAFNRGADDFFTGVPETEIPYPWWAVSCRNYWLRGWRYASGDWSEDEGEDRGCFDPKFTPPPEEIAAACKELQKEWEPQEFDYRRASIPLLLNKGGLETLRRVWREQNASLP